MQGVVRVVTTLKIKDWIEEYTILALYEDVPQRASLNTV